MDHPLSPLVRAPRVVAAVAGSLVIESGSLRGQRFLLPLPPCSLTLGRDVGCSIRFPSEQEAERLMGRRHAQIDIRTDGVFLIDLSSANGTELTLTDGRMQQVSGQVQLQSGMRIALGGEDGVWISVQLTAVAESTKVGGAPHLQSSLAPQNEPTLVQTSAAAVHQIPPTPAYQLGEPQQQRPLVHCAPVQPPLATMQAQHEQPPPPAYFALTAPRPEQPPQVQQSRLQADAAKKQHGTGQDHELQQHRVLFIRQVAVIFALLLLGCAAGVLVAIRAPAEESTATSAQ